MDTEVSHRRLTRDLKILELLLARSISTVPSWKENQIFAAAGITDIAEVQNGNISFNSSNTTDNCAPNVFVHPTLVENRLPAISLRNVGQASNSGSLPFSHSPGLSQNYSENPTLNIKITGVQGYQQPVTRIYYCDKCGYGTSWESALRSHVKQIHMKLKKFECLVCGFTTKRKRVLNAHMKSHKGVLTYHCSLHKKKEDRRTPCQFTTRLKSLFILHLQSHSTKALHATKLLKCTKCWYSTSNRKMLIRHKHIYHSPQTNLPVIPKAQQSYISNYYMYLHYGVFPYRCSDCSYVTSSQEKMSEHVQRHKLMFRCPECPYVCNFKTKMILHLRQHQSQKNTLILFKCIFCDYETKHKNALYTHMRTHTHDRPYRCHICDYSAIQKVHLDAHMYKHNGVLPFKCSLCKYKTATKASLKAHMCKHTGVKPFRCEHCDYRSARKADLKKHVSIRHKKEFRARWG